MLMAFAISGSKCSRSINFCYTFIVFICLLVRISGISAQVTFQSVIVKSATEAFPEKVKIKALESRSNIRFETTPVEQGVAWEIFGTVDAGIEGYIFADAMPAKAWFVSINQDEIYIRKPDENQPANWVWQFYSEDDTLYLSQWRQNGFGTWYCTLEYDHSPIEVISEDTDEAKVVRPRQQLVVYEQIRKDKPNLYINDKHTPENQSVIFNVAAAFLAVYESFLRLGSK